MSFLTPSSGASRDGLTVRLGHGKGLNGLRAPFRPTALVLEGALSSVLVSAWFAPNGAWWPWTWDEVVTNTAFASLAASAFAVYLTRRIMMVPKVSHLGFVVLSAISAFWVTWWALKLGKMPFANTQFFSSLGLFLGCMVAIAVADRRIGAPLFAVIPGYSPHLSDPVQGVRLVQLVHPDDGLKGCQGIVADFSTALSPEWERFVANAALRGIQVMDVSQFDEAARGRANIDDHTGRNFVGVLPALVYPQVKRTIDLMGVVVLFVPVAVVIAVCAVLIRRDGEGPVFFRQARMGYRGRVFQVWKLRTMDHSVESQGPAFTEYKDPRVTRVGRVLRQYRLDELPQIINILKGEMSWIGPRPEAHELSLWYEREIPFYAYRHVVRPGISGWAQVNQGNVAEIDAARRKLEYDFFYIKHLSFWLDAVIFVKTFRTILTGFGSK